MVDQLVDQLANQQSSNLSAAEDIMKMIMELKASIAIKSAEQTDNSELYKIIEQYEQLTIKLYKKIYMIKEFYEQQKRENLVRMLKAIEDRDKEYESLMRHNMYLEGIVRDLVAGMEDSMNLLSG